MAHLPSTASHAAAQGRPHPASTPADSAVDKLMFRKLMPLLIIAYAVSYTHLTLPTSDLV